MRNVYVVADNIFSPLGKNTSANMEALKNGHSAIQLITIPVLSPQSFYASLFPSEDKSGTHSLSGFRANNYGFGIRCHSTIIDRYSGQQKWFYTFFHERKYQSG